LWGERFTELFEQFFHKAVMEKGHHLFYWPSTAHIAEDNDKALVFQRCEPNDYQSNRENFTHVYKLATKGKWGRNAELVRESFPTLITWKENTYFHANGQPVRHPSMWSTGVDETKIVFADLLQIEEVDTKVESPAKKQRL
jgi:hypothetical protein